MYIPVDAWLRAFLLTLVVEVPIVVWLLRAAGPGRARLAAIAVFASLATHPVVWFVVPQVLYESSNESLLVSEAWAVLVEALFYAVVLPGLRPARALGASLVANLASVLVGLAVTAAWPQAFS